MAGIKLGQHPVHQRSEICVAEWGSGDAWHAHKELSPALDVQKAGDLAGNGGDLVIGACPVGAMTTLTLEHPGQSIPRIFIGKRRGRSLNQPEDQEKVHTAPQGVPWKVLN